MKKKKKRLNPRLNLLIILPLLLFMSFNTFAQLKVNDNVELYPYKFLDIPFLIFNVNISNSDTSVFEKINDYLFITYPDNPAVKNHPFYISNSLEMIPHKTKNRDGIIAFRGNTGNYILQSTLNISKITSNLVKYTGYDNFKNEAYALALILALESYKTGDTLVNYYYEKYYKDNLQGMKIQDDVSLECYLEGALIRAKNIHDNKKEDLTIPEIKEITKHYSESRNNGNNDSVFNRSLRNYYVELARYYSKSGEKDYKTISGYYQDAMDIELKGESFGNSDLFNFANALFYIEQDNWAEEKSFDFEICRRYYEELMRNGFRLCDVYLKLGAIYYMDNYEKGDFQESKKYFNKVIENKCTEQAEKAEKNLKKIEELERKK